MKNKPCVVYMDEEKRVSMGSKGFGELIVNCNSHCDF